MYIQFVWFLLKYHRGHGHIALKLLQKSLHLLEMVSILSPLQGVIAEGYSASQAVSQVRLGNYFSVSFCI